MCVAFWFEGPHIIHKPKYLHTITIHDSSSFRHKMSPPRCAVLVSYAEFNQKKIHKKTGSGLDSGFVCCLIYCAVAVLKVPY